jgi:hypothetical protein
METQYEPMIFTLAGTKFRCKIQPKIVRMIPMLCTCYNSEYSDNRKFTCNLPISEDSAKTFLIWKKWAIGDIERPDFSQVAPKQWAGAAELAAYFMDYTFFDIDSCYYVLPPLSVMRDEIINLVPEARDIYFSEYLTQTMCPHCTCPNRHVEELNRAMDKYSPKEKSMLGTTYGFLTDLFQNIYYSHFLFLSSSGSEWKELCKYFGKKCETYAFRNIEEMNSRDNQIFVDFIFSEELQKLVETALSFDETYIDRVAKGTMYNFLQLSAEDKLVMFDYFCYHRHFSQQEKARYKCVCDFSFYRKWRDFVTKDPFVAKLIFDTLDRQELVRATGIVKKGGCIKKLESFDDLIKYINFLAPKVNTNNLSSEEKKKLAKEANKKWDQSKYQNAEYLKTHVQAIKVITAKK